MDAKICWAAVDASVVNAFSADSNISYDAITHYGHY